MLWATTSTVSNGWPLVYCKPERNVAKAPARSSMVAVDDKLHVLKNRLTSPLLSSTWSAMPNVPANVDGQPSNWNPLINTTGGSVVTGTGCPDGISCADAEIANNAPLNKRKRINEWERAAERGSR